MLSLATLLPRRPLPIIMVGGILVILLAILLPRAQAADRAPVGPPVQLSPNDLLSHRRPSVAVDAAGNAVVVWQSGQDSPDIYAQLITAGGIPRGAAFRVHSTLSGSQRRPVVAMAANGSFIVAWDGAGPGDAQGVWMRRFNAAGSPLGAEQLVNTTIAGDQLQPALAMTPQGAFVIVWEGAVPDDATGVAFRRFTATAFPRDPVDRVPYAAPQPTCSTRGSPAAALAASDVLAIAWESYACDQATFAETFSITVQRYAASGAAQEPITLASADDGALVGEPAIAYDSRDGLAAAWSRRPSGSVQALIEAVRLDAGGASVQAPLVVSAAQPAERFGPQVVVDTADRAVIAWADRSAPAGVVLGLAARVLEPDGSLGDDLLTPALGAPNSGGIGQVGLAGGRSLLNDLLFAWDVTPNPAAGQPAVYGRAYRSPGVIVNRSATLLRLGGSPITLSVALATTPSGPVQVTLTPRDAHLRLANLAPGAPLTLTFTPATATQPQVLTVATGDALIAGESATALLDIAVSSADPAYGAAAGILIDGAFERTAAFTLLADEQPGVPPFLDDTPTPMPPEATPAPTPSPTTELGRVQSRLYLPLIR